MKFLSTFTVAASALLVSASVTFADDFRDKPDAPVSAKSTGRVLVLGDSGARFHVERNAEAGRMTFRLADPIMVLEGEPVVLMTTSEGPREVKLTRVQGQQGVWVWNDDVVRQEQFDGSLRIISSGKTYSSRLNTVWTSEPNANGSVEPLVKPKPLHGGRVVHLSDCGTCVEVVQDQATGALTIYSFEGYVISQAPQITITEAKGPTTLTMTRVQGPDGGWTTKHQAFQTRTTSAHVLIAIDGALCKVPVTFGLARGGRVVTVADGPSFEVVRDTDAGHYTFYAVDETVNGKAYTVENPTVVVDGRTHTLTRVEGEPRAWRLAGLDAAGSDARDAQLNFTLLGRTLSTRLGLSGFHLGAR